MSEPTNCPFCGKSDKVIIYTESMEHHGKLLWTRYGVKCKRCRFEMPTYSEKETAIRKWNTRPAEDAKDKEIERLKAEVTRYRRALHNLKEDCQTRLHWKSSSLEGLFLHEVITHIDAELDFAPDMNNGKMEEK